MHEEKFADLHLHTYYSDGTFSPQILMQRALDEGLSCISITDHDTVEAIPVAFAYRPENLEVIPGIELSCDGNNREVHILGYFLDYQKESLLKRLEAISKQRIERIHTMVDRLRKLNVDISADEVFGISKFGTVGRLHLAKILLKKKFVSSIHEAFAKFIGEGGPAYEGRFRIGAEEAIKLILDSSGVPVLAHPYIIADDSFIERLVGFGLKGIEVYYPEHSHNQVEHYKDLAKKFNLVATGGSDCHGAIKDDIKVGSVRIPYEVVEKLKKAKDEIAA